MGNINIKNVLQSLCELKCFAHSNKKIFPFQKDSLQGIESNLNNINNYLDFFIKEEKDYFEQGFQNAFNKSITENIEEIVPTLFSTEVMKPLETSFEYKRFKDLSNQVIKDKNFHSNNANPKINDMHTIRLQSLIDIKRDENYELFYIKKNSEEGFFSNSLKNILKKQEKKFSNTSLDDPLVKTNIWGDIQKQIFSKSLIKSSYEQITNFYHVALENLDKKIVDFTHKALMSLFLAKNSQNLLSNLSIKPCSKYFQDFIFFFRKALLEKLSSYEMNENYLRITVDLLNSLSENIFIQRCFYDDVYNFLKEKIEFFKNSRETFNNKKPSVVFLDLYEKLDNFFKQFPNGPLFKAIDIVISKEELVFDTFDLGFLPNYEGVLYLEDNYPIKVTRLAAPIVQTSFQNVKVSEEFINFIEISEKLDKKILFIYLENRKHPKSQSRAKILEELSEKTNSFFIITLPDSFCFVDYLDEKYTTNNINEFIQAFYLEITSSSSFYFFHNSIERDIISSILDIEEKVKSVFFDTKKSFFKNNKLFFLDLISSILILKSLEFSKANQMLISSKDGLDSAISSLYFLELFIKTISRREQIQESFIIDLITKLLSPTLIMRDRLLFPEKVETLGRLISWSNKKVKGTVKELSSIFLSNIENWRIEM